MQVQRNQVDPRDQKVQVVRRRRARAQSDHALSKNPQEHEKPQRGVTARRLPSQRHSLLSFLVRVKQPARDPREIPLRSRTLTHQEHHVSTDQGPSLYALEQRHPPGYQARKPLNLRNQVTQDLRLRVCQVVQKIRVGLYRLCGDKVVSATRIVGGGTL